MRRHCLPLIAAAMWYLLIPPLSGQRGVDSTAPLPSWQKGGTYVSRDECQAAKGSYAKVLSSSGYGDEQRTQGILAIQNSKCVASDDFRLAGAQPLGGQQSAGSPQQNLGR